MNHINAQHLPGLVTHAQSRHMGYCISQQKPYINAMLILFMHSVPRKNVQNISDKIPYIDRRMLSDSQQQII